MLNLFRPERIPLHNKHTLTSLPVRIAHSETALLLRLDFLKMLDSHGVALVVIFPNFLGTDLLETEADEGA